MSCLQSLSVAMVRERYRRRRRGRRRRSARPRRAAVDTAPVIRLRTAPLVLRRVQVWQMPIRHPFSGVRPAASACSSSERPSSVDVDAAVREGDSSAGRVAPATSNDRRHEALGVHVRRSARGRPRPEPGGPQTNTASGDRHGGRQVLGAEAAVRGRRRVRSGVAVQHPDTRASRPARRGSRPRRRCGRSARRRSRRLALGDQGAQHRHHRGDAAAAGDEQDAPRAAAPAARSRRRRRSRPTTMPRRACSYR